MEKVQSASRIMEKLIDLAMADEVVTNEEKAILSSINEALHNYLNVIISSLNTGMVDKEQLKKMETEIVKKCEKIAESDGKVTEEEKVLLDELVYLVEELSSI